MLRRKQALGLFAMFLEKSIDRKRLCLLVDAFLKIEERSLEIVFEKNNVKVEEVSEVTLMETPTISAKYDYLMDRSSVNYFEFSKSIDTLVYKRKKFALNSISSAIRIPKCKSHKRSASILKQISHNYNNASKILHNQCKKSLNKAFTEILKLSTVNRISKISNAKLLLLKLQRILLCTKSTSFSKIKFCAEHRAKKEDLVGTFVHEIHALVRRLGGVYSSFYKLKVHRKGSRGVILEDYNRSHMGLAAKNLEFILQPIFDRRKAFAFKAIVNLDVLRETRSRTTYWARLSTVLKPEIPEMLRTLRKDSIYGQLFGEFGNSDRKDAMFLTNHGMESPVINALELDFNSQMVKSQNDLSKPRKQNSALPEELELVFGSGGLNQQPMLSQAVSNFQATSISPKNLVRSNSTVLSYKENLLSVHNRPKLTAKPPKKDLSNGVPKQNIKGQPELSVLKTKSTNI